jgi:tetratricopeptide (TPR) repeat protein
LKSPAHTYETKELGDRRIYTWSVKDFVPDRKHEREAIREEPDFTPDVQLSTFADWPQVAEWYAKLQGDRVVVDDGVRQKATELTKGASAPAEKARRLYNYVALNIRYVSLSFGVGRLQPHSASEVLQNGYGDCKDKHTLLQSLLKAENIQSYPVLISSYRDLDPDVPSPAQFNHEITAAEVGGELTWLDSTAEVAPYGLILYQLRNKQALLAAEGKMGGIRRTPASAPVKNQFSIKLDGKFTEEGAFDTGVEITAQGDSDWPLRSAFRTIPQARWTDALKNLSSMWGLAGDVSDIQVDSLEDTSKPFHLAYRYHKDNYFTVPNSGVSFRILPPMQLRFARSANPKKPLEPVNVGPAIEEAYRAHIQFPANYSVQVPGSASMTRDYGDYSLSYEIKQHVLEAVRRVTLKVNELPASRRNDYESFENATGAEIRQLLTASIAPASAAALAAAAKSGSTPDELRKAGTLALQRRDFAAAADLLKRATDQDPSHKDTWDDLGRAYVGLNQHEDAVRAFRKQLDVDAFHKSANQELASELQKQQKFDEAIAAYRNQLGITPFDKAAHKSLGLLLAQLSRDSDAIKEMEDADAVPPDDPELKMALARVYARTGNTAKAETLTKSVTGVGGSESGADIYASALGQKIDSNQTVREARKTLDDVGDQFDSGEFDRSVSSAFRAMDLVALAWARIGWAKFQQGETLEGLQYLNSSWLLSQSGTVENRLAQVLQKEGQREKSRHAFALAVAAGGGEVAASREQLLKFSNAPDAAEKEIADARSELLQGRTIKFPAPAGGKGSAQFVLIFDSSNKPDRAEWLEGDASLRSASDELRKREYPVKFPDVSSIKVVRKADISCDGSGCVVVLQPLEGLQDRSFGATQGAK